MIVPIASTQGKGPSMKLMRLSILSLPFVIAMAINEIQLFFWLYKKYIFWFMDVADLMTNIIDTCQS